MPGSTWTDSRESSPIILQEARGKGGVEDSQGIVGRRPWRLEAGMGSGSRTG